MSRMLDICRIRGGFESITVDCAVKPTIPLLGKAIHNVTNYKKAKQAAPYAAPYRSLLIVRGSSGAPFYWVRCSRGISWLLLFCTPEIHGGTDGIGLPHVYR